MPGSKVQFCQTLGPHWFIVVDADVWPVSGAQGGGGGVITQSVVGVLGHLSVVERGSGDWGTNPHELDRGGQQ